MGVLWLSVLLYRTTFKAVLISCCHDHPHLPRYTMQIFRVAAERNPIQYRLAYGSEEGSSLGSLGLVGWLVRLLDR